MTLTDVSQNTGGGLLAFPRWWGRELAALVPAPLARLMGNNPGWLIVDVDDNEMVLSHSRDGTRLNQVDRLQRAGSGVPLDSRLLRAVERRAAKRRVAVRVPSEWCLTKRLTLPLAAEENLRQVLAFEMDRQTPFRAEDVHYSFAVAGRDIEQERIAVDLTVLPRQRLGDLLEQLAGAGVRVGVLAVDDGVARQLGKVNMLANSDTDGTAPPFGVLNWLLLATAVGLMGALIYLTIDRQRQVLALLDTRAGSARQAAQAVPILRKKATALAAEAVFLQERKATSISTVGLLEELSALLPDHTWLTLLELKGGEIRLNGFSQSSSEILGLIEASPHFRDARFLAPVTRDARRNAEKFSLTANLSLNNGGGG